MKIDCVSVTFSMNDLCERKSEIDFVYRDRGSSIVILDARQIDVLLKSFELVSDISVIRQKKQRKNG